MFLPNSFGEKIASRKTYKDRLSKISYVEILTDLYESKRAKVCRKHIQPELKTSLLCMLSFDFYTLYRELIAN